MSACPVWWAVSQCTVDDGQAEGEHGPGGAPLLPAVVGPARPVRHLLVGGLLRLGRTLHCRHTFCQENHYEHTGATVDGRLYKFIFVF